MVVYLKTGESCKKEVPSGAIKHCAYIKALLEAAPDDSNAEIDVPHGDANTIQFMCDFLEQHEADEEVAEGWQKQPPRPLTDWDTSRLLDFAGMPLVDLLKAAHFIGCQLMLNAAAIYIGQVMANKSEKEVREYFGLEREFTEEEAAQVKAKYPAPFY